MKKLQPLLLAVLMTSLLFSCSRQEDQLGPISVSFTSDMECKSNTPMVGDQTDSWSPCVNFIYAGDSLLTLQHLNACFNCCPENFTVAIELKGDSLLITEDDVKQGCKCNCLFNLDIVIHNLPAGTYHVRFIEPCVNATIPQLMFDLNLKETKEGQVCVTRSEGWCL